MLNYENTPFRIKATSSKLWKCLRNQKHFRTWPFAVHWQCHRTTKILRKYERRCEIWKLSSKFEYVVLRTHFWTARLFSHYENIIEMRKYLFTTKTFSNYENIVALRKYLRTTKMSSHYGNIFELRKYLRTTKKNIFELPEYLHVSKTSTKEWLRKSSSKYTFERNESNCELRKYFPNNA